MQQCTANVSIGLNYLIDIEHAVVVDVEATPARTYDEVAATKTMIVRTEKTLAKQVLTNLKRDFRNTP